jgi:hypothetical protein
MKRPLAAGEQPDPRQRNGNAVGLLGLLSSPHRFCSHATPLGKAAQFGQAPGDMATGDHGGQRGPAEARIAQLAGEHYHRPPRSVQRLPEVPHGTVRHAQGTLGDDLDVKSIMGSSQGEGPLASHNGLVMFAHGREGAAQMAGNQPEPLGIAQPLGDGLGGVQAVQDPWVVTKRQQGIAQVTPQINGLLQRAAALGELRQSR